MEATDMPMARKRGRAAHLAGRKFTDCVYAVGTPARTQWEKGYREVALSPRLLHKKMDDICIANTLREIRLIYFPMCDPAYGSVRFTALGMIQEYNIYKKAHRDGLPPPYEDELAERAAMIGKGMTVEEAIDDMKEVSWAPPQRRG